MARGVIIVQTVGLSNPVSLSAPEIGFFISKYPIDKIIEDYNEGINLI
jgi:hypothetical protein